MASRRTLIAVLALLALAACDYPRDAEDTLQRVHREGVLRVGYSLRPPWVMATQGGVPAGIEPRLVQAFAAQIGAQPTWTHGTEATLIAALQRRQLDLVIGGHLQGSPWAQQAAATQPFARTRLVIGAPAARPPAQRALEAHVVAYLPSRPDIGALIAKRGVQPEAAADRRGRFAAVYDFELDALALAATSAVLARESIVMFAPPGESRFLLELDRFLQRSAAPAIEAWGRPP